MSSISIRTIRLTLATAFLAVSISCSQTTDAPTSAPTIAHITIATGELGYIEVPLRGRTQVIVQARAADGSLVRDVPTPTLISRDTTRFVVDSGLFVRSVGAGGTATIVARLVVDGRTLTDSTRASTVIPLGSLPSLRTLRPHSLCVGC
jgi:hypothetical protein